MTILNLTYLSFTNANMGEVPLKNVMKNVMKRNLKNTPACNLTFTLTKDFNLLFINAFMFT